jgi:hypothetical protein
MARAVALAAAAMLGLAACGAGREDASAPAIVPAAPAPRPPALCRALGVRMVGRVTDPAANELSGLVRGRSGVLWTHDDSGGAPELFALAADGRVLGRPRVTGAEAIDWEDIAAAGASLYIGDIGDNGTERPTIDVYRVPEPAPGATATAPAVRLRLRYPDGPHDAEALLVDPLRGDLVIVTKALGGTHAYRTSARRAAGSEATLRRGPTVPLALVTGGAVSADGRIVALRTYTRVGVWARRGREPLTRTLRRAPCVSPVSLAAEGQGEALALDRRGTGFLTVPEGTPATLRRYASSHR